MKKIFFAILVLLFYNFGFSHEHWVDLENFSPSVGEKTKIFACSGHYFPKSDEVLSERVFNGFKIIDPDGKEKILETNPDNKLKSRVAEFTFDKEGTYIILFSLQRPPLKKQLYIAKSIVVVGKWTELKYQPADGLDIVVEKNFSQIKVLYEGKPVSLTVSVSINGKKNFYLRTNKDGYLPLKITSLGKYLITAEYKGVGTSLTFYISEVKK